MYFKLWFYYCNHPSGEEVWEKLLHCTMLGGSYVLMVYKYMYSASYYPGKFQSYCSVPHIRPPFCNLSATRKRRGGLYAGSDILSREYAPSSGATPRWWRRNIVLQTNRSWRSALATNSVVPVPRAPETRWSRSTDRGWPQRRQWVCPFNVLLLTDTTRLRSRLRSTVNSLAALGRWLHSCVATGTLNLTV